MKRIKKSFLATIALAATVTLSACSSNDSFGLTIDNGDADFITSDLGNVTNQEVFEAMVTSTDNYGLKSGISTLIDLVDWDLLNGQFEIDEEEIDSIIDNYKSIYEDWDSFLTSNGFESEEELRQVFELSMLREAAARAQIEITDEEIEATYNEFYGTTEEDEEVEEETDTDVDADTEEETDVDTEEEEEEEEEVPTLEEARNEIEEYLITEQLTSAFTQTELARLRQEAGFKILDSVLQDQYIAFLEAYEVVVDDVFKSTKTTSNTVAATLGDIEYTAQQLYDELIPLVGLSSAIGLLDPTILGNQFEVDEDEIKDIIDNLKISYEDQYYPMMSYYYNLNTDEEIFNYVKLVQLQDAAFVAQYTPSEERLQELYEAYEPNISARHILVEDEETAKDIIAQLEASDDVETLFAELAAEYSIDTTTAENGGDLGSFGRGEMVSEFEEAAFALKVGEFTKEPVETEDYGFHVIYVYAQDEKADFEDLRETLIDQELNDLYSSERLEIILADLRAEVNFKFVDETLQARYDEVVANLVESLEEAE